MLVIVHDLQSPSSVPTTPPTKKLKSSHLCTLSPNSPGQLNVLGHDGNPLCMDSTQVGILKQANQVCFTGFLQSKQTKVNPSRRIQSHRSNSCICFYKCGGGPTCRAPIAALWKRRSVLKSWAISLTRRWNGSFLMSSSVDFWYLRISRRATVPGLQIQKKPNICQYYNLLHVASVSINLNKKLSKKQAGKIHRILSLS